MKTILILMDTLQRKMIHAYNPGSEAITPNIDRLAARSVVFDQHYIGSAPCMPARRDILPGRRNFLERNWGPVEPFDITFPALLRQRGVVSHMSPTTTIIPSWAGKGISSSITPGNSSAARKTTPGPPGSKTRKCRKNSPGGSTGRTF